ncbi:MAG: hypothetical protein K2J96_01360, partial [Bacteroidaceae bacterium]|nr:hypothetical protein [Bacteroidaceae bacterium]
LVRIVFGLHGSDSQHQSQGEKKDTFHDVYIISTNYDYTAFPASARHRPGEGFTLTRHFQLQRYSFFAFFAKMQPDYLPRVLHSRKNKTGVFRPKDARLARIRCPSCCCKTPVFHFGRLQSGAAVAQAQGVKKRGPYAESPLFFCTFATE